MKQNFPNGWIARAVACGVVCAAVAGSAAADPPTYRDTRVTQSTYDAPVDRRVGSAPARPREPEPMPIGRSDDRGGQEKAAGRPLRSPSTPGALPALVSMMGSLAVVVGLFLAVVWVMKRGGAVASRLLPGEVVESLGRAPLGTRQQMHVIRFGSKLLLVSLTPAGAETLAEIADPAEVDRLAGLCQQTHSQSATGAFRHALKQFTQDGRLSWTKMATAAPTKAPTPRGVPPIDEV